MGKRQQRRHWTSAAAALVCALDGTWQHPSPPKKELALLFRLCHRRLSVRGCNWNVIESLHDVSLVWLITWSLHPPYIPPPLSLSLCLYSACMYIFGPVSCCRLFVWWWRAVALINEGRPGQKRIKQNKIPLDLSFSLSLSVRPHSPSFHAN